MKREKKLKVPFIFQMFTSSKKYLSRFLGLLWKEVKGLVEIIHSFIPQLKALQAVTVRVLITAWIPPGQRFCLNSWRRGGEPECQRARAGAEPGSGQQLGPSEAGPVGPRWAWRSRPSPRETEGRSPRRARRAWCTTQECFKMARNSIHPETETSLSSSELANRKSSRVLKRAQPRHRVLSMCQAQQELST
ncbi:peptidyl-prolyl cis-trans isomerase FKBP1B isoform X1 [Bos taurus]|uniref:peptidyl-prolyl cis-trans isomerase FKBP1B isoform X1 n=1 Tax=Bos taurus TaxID=9913 RepID=UPI0028CB22AE|nr:peptidyl-prolyl cis-trans isomerase FKBP1B isoform X1 [Bos taurus]